MSDPSASESDVPSAGGGWDLEALLQNEAYHWRRDPLESQSDWILEVRIQGKEDRHQLKASSQAQTQYSESSSDSGNTPTAAAGSLDDASCVTYHTGCDDYSVLPVELYHIHKAVMALGPEDRRSRYLLRLFRSAPRSACELRLPAVVAHAVPVWLDYMYGAPLRIETPSAATALVHLGRRLEIPDLERRAFQFCIADLRLRNAHLYYQQAERLGEARVLSAAARFVGAKIRALHWRVPLVDEAPPEFWLRVLPHCASARRASLFVAVAGARAHADHRLVARLFAQLTLRRLLPEVDARVACTLLRLEAELGLQDAPLGSGAGDGLTCLQRRCFAALARDWLQVTPETLSFLTKNLPPHLLHRLMEELDQTSDGGWSSHNDPGPHHRHQHPSACRVVVDCDTNGVSGTMRRSPNGMHLNYFRQSSCGQSSAMSSSIDEMNRMLLGEGQYFV